MEQMCTAYVRYNNGKGWEGSAIEMCLWFRDTEKGRNSAGIGKHFACGCAIYKSWSVHDSTQAGS